MEHFYRGRSTSGVGNLKERGISKGRGRVCFNTSSEERSRGEKEQRKDVEKGVPGFLLEKTARTERRRDRGSRVKAEKILGYKRQGRSKQTCERIKRGKKGGPTKQREDVSIRQRLLARQGKGRNCKSKI